MAMIRVLGVDPGINGACALHVPGENVVGPEQVFDIPTMGSGKQREINYLQLSRQIWMLQPTHAFIEKLNAFVPKKKDEDTGEMVDVEWGTTSKFKFGGAFYAIKAIVCCLEIPCREVNAGEWMAAFNVPGGKENDDAARLIAIQRYPVVAPLLPLKKHIHKAEAWLIGVYGARKVRREEENDSLVIPE